MPPDRREKNYQFKTFSLADKGSRGTSQKSALPAHFHVRPVDKSVRGGKYRQRKNLSISTSSVSWDKQNRSVNIYPLFGAFLNIYTPVLREVTPVSTAASTSVLLLCLNVCVCVCMPKCALRLCKWIQKMFRSCPTYYTRVVQLLTLTSQSPSFFKFSSLLLVY